MTAYQRRSMPRSPRREELDLLLLLADGPRALVQGPIGRCLKKGWCCMVSAQESANAELLYTLTSQGRRLLDDYATSTEDTLGASQLARNDD